MVVAITTMSNALIRSIYVGIDCGRRWDNKHHFCDNTGITPPISMNYRYILDVHYFAIKFEIYLILNFDSQR